MIASYRLTLRAIKAGLSSAAFWFFNVHRCKLLIKRSKLTALTRKIRDMTVLVSVKVSIFASLRDSGFSSFHMLCWIGEYTIVSALFNECSSANSKSRCSLRLLLVIALLTTVGIALGADALFEALLTPSAILFALSILIPVDLQFLFLIFTILKTLILF